MPNESAQPFDQTQRDRRDSRLVSQVLGPDAAAEMEALTGSVQEQEVESEVVGLDISADEQDMVGEAEKTEAEKRREEYIEWAVKIGKDEDWVDDTFTFKINGTVIAEGSINLPGFKIDTLPPKLIKVVGYINLNDNQITSLEGMPDTVGGNLYLGNNQITSLKGLPDVVHGFLSLNKNQTLTSLDGLPKKIDGSLNLVGILATSIPAGLDIKGKIFLTIGQTKLIADCQAKRYNVEIR